MSDSSPPPSTTWKEQIADDEAQRFERHAQTLRELQKKHAGGGAASRALHAKGKCALEATFTVLPDLPSQARAGLFAQPGTYRAYVRYSNGAGKHQPDPTPDVRGIAIKLVGVPGKKLIPGMEDATTQDFLAIRSASTPFRNVDEFVGFVRAAASPALLIPRVISLLGFSRALRVLGQLAKGLKEPMVSVATTTYYSALPIACGDHAVRFRLRPCSEAAAGAQPGSDPDYLRAELASRVAKGPVEYDFALQFFVSEDKTPIEDASKDWSEADSPYVTVARLTLPQQDLASPRGQKLSAFIEKLSFDPWHALVAHRPLGNMMRARNFAYRVSTQERQAAKEPDGSERFDS